MALLSFARSLTGTSHQATPVTLAIDPTNPAGGRVPTDGDPLEAVVIDLPSSEARVLGVELPGRMRRVYFDPTEDGSPPVQTQEQLKARGETINVLSVQRIEAGSFAGSIIDGVVVNE